MRVLITGASGFLGSAVATAFIQRGYQVSLLVRPHSKLDRLHGKEAQFKICRAGSDQEIVSFIQQVEPQITIHTACAYGRAGETALEMSDANVRFALVVLEALQRSNEPVTLINAGTALARNISAYALSKHQFLDWARLLANDSPKKLQFVNVFLQHLYGAGDDPAKFVTQIIHRCMRNDPEIELTSGEQRRDFIYIDDAVSAFATLVEQRSKLRWNSDIELGSGTAHKVRSLVEYIHELTHSRTKLCFGALPYRENEPMIYQADIKQMTALGWHPKYDIDTGLERSVALERRR